MPEMGSAGMLGELLVSPAVPVRRPHVRVELFRVALESPDPLFRLLHIHGPPVIGKTSPTRACTSVATGSSGRRWRWRPGCRCSADGLRVGLRWQNDLESRLSHSGVMACRSILLRILEAARRERLGYWPAVCADVRGRSSWNEGSARGADGRQL
jgi:hypothetical protein